MATGYKATVYVESGKIGHAFIKLEAPGQPAITVGYYPIVSSPEGPGTVKNDATTGPVNPRTKELSQHDGEPIKTFNIDANQYASMIGYVNHVANNPGGYGLVGNQCTSFVVDTLSKGGITNDNHLDNFAVVHPTALISFLKPLDVNQIIDPNATINSAQITANISGINQGIATHHPQDPNYQDTLNNRIAPVGTVVIGNDTTSTPNTILSPDGRNSLDPRRVDLANGGGGAGAAPEEKPTTVFNPTTALPTNKGEYTVTVQPGDTVSSIAAKLGMSAKEYSDFLQSEYGSDADLNSIVAGRQLPVPKDVHDKLTGADLDPTNPNGKNAVNGSDKQSDNAAAKREGEEAGQKYGDFGEDKTQSETPAFTPIAATKDLPPDQVLTLADSGSGTQTDGGNTTGYGNDSENSSNTDTNTHVVSINTASTATNNIANNANSNTNIPIISDDGYDPRDYVVPSYPASNSAQQDFRGSEIITQTVSNTDQQNFRQSEIGSQNQDAADQRNLSNGISVLSLGSSFLTLQDWDNLSDLSRVQTSVGIYNQINSLGDLGMPSMAGPISVLSFYSAVQSGDGGKILYSGLQMVDTLTAGAGALGIISTFNPNIIPGLGLILALSNIEENPLGVIIAACAFIPVYGQIIAVVLSICQALFTPAPVSEGEAHATFDATGNIIVTTDSEKNGGGSTANHWMEQLAKGAQLAGLQTPQAGAYTVGMPTVGYRYNPEGFNDVDKNGETINGQLTLRWVDPNGVAHSRVYAGDGTGALGWGDEKDENIGDDFMELMQSAVKQYPPLAYQQLDGGVLQLDYGVATVVYATNTRKFDGLAEHTHGGGEDTDAAQDEAIVIAEGVIIYYEFNSKINNKYAGYSFNASLKYDSIYAYAANDDVWAVRRSNCSN